MIVQGSEEWLLQRVGNFTASRMADLMAKTKSGPSTSRANMIATLVVERITGKPVDTYKNAAMQRGTELEPQARDAYAFEFGVTVEEVGYIEHPRIQRVGCSPDGIVGKGLVEIKCPSAMGKHLDAVRFGSHAREYKWQLQHQLFVTGKEWVDAVSYHPDFPENMQLAVVRVSPDQESFEQIEAEITLAESEIQSIIAELLNVKRS